jgi:hypothetical protein
MSSSLKVIARTLSDDPLLVRRRPTKELFVPHRIYYTRTVIEPRSSFENMTARKARRKGFEVSANIPDDKLVRIEWVEDIERKITWYEQRLRTRGHRIKSDDKEIIIPRRKQRHITMRAELADAIDDPLTYIRYDKLRKLIKEEIDHWRNNNMLGENPRPIILVFLGLNEDSSGTHTTYSRDIYFIKNFDEYNMIVVNCNDKEFEINFEKNVYETGVISQFIVFLPANMHMYDSVTGENLV